ncbi:hypothetical protein DFP72DRAFT_1075825 [Ephemerocybe angulata]|uniref:Uncharacterized protein n=1 Tax=Ephemerocybe angulata TaxID=980116 RepID=A0A8H6HJR5_9AGAR|nr:hypothetical protein DFP72DRAFT_1075825 [Tulosesus angulatus]
MSETASKSGHVPFHFPGDQSSEPYVAPEFESSAAKASTSKEVLAFAPPLLNSKSHLSTLTAAERDTVKFTEGTEANKPALIPDEPIIDSLSTSSKKKARVILPLPKRSQRQSARLTARVEVARLAPKAAPKADCIASAPAPKGRAQSDENDKDNKNSTRPNTPWRIVKFAEDA